MKKRIRWWKAVLKAIQRAKEARENCEVFVYMGIPIADVEKVELEELVCRTGDSVAVLVGRMTPEEAEERLTEREKRTEL